MVFQRHLLSANLVSQKKCSMFIENDFPEVEPSDLNCRLLVKPDQHYLKQPKSLCAQDIITSQLMRLVLILMRIFFSGTT